jgi:DinB superfamily
MQNQYLEDLLHEVSLITKKVEAEFGRLDAGQLNWKPSPDQWSIAQCLDHLIRANGEYFPLLEGVAQGTRKRSFMEKLPVLPGFFGNLMLKAMDPANQKKLRSPAPFRPGASQLPGSIVADFVQHQQQLIRLIRATDNVDHEKTIVSSPISGLITFRLRDTIRIIVVHEERHFMQAKRLFKATGFPNPPRQEELPVSPVRPANPRQQNRSDRSNRPHRPPHANRPDSSDASDRPKRAPRPDRSGRPPRSEQTDRSPRSENPNRPPRSSNGDRPSRSENPKRPPRPDNADRPPRPDNADRPPRPDNADRPPRDNRSERPRRSGRPNGSGRSNRPPRPEGSDRPTPPAST